MAVTSKSMLLFGAGASRPAGVPLAGEMTNEMLRRLQRHRNDLAARTLKVIVGALQMADGEVGDFQASVDVERVMNAAIQLSERMQLEFAPFVAIWHPVLEALEAEEIQNNIANKAASAAQRELRMLGSRHTDGQITSRAIEGALQEAFREFGGGLAKKSDGRLFHLLVNELTNMLFDFTWIEEKADLSYLEPIVRAAADKRITVATLNYDNSIERVADQLRVPFETGISHWKETGSWPSIDNGVDLVKLHGSVTWIWSQPKIVLEQNMDPTKTLPQLVELSSAERDKAQEALWVSRAHGRTSPFGVIFGGRNKLTASGPFLDLLFRFREDLKKKKNLIAIGYSFRDSHINGSILSWLLRDKKRRLTVVDRPGSDPRSSLFQQGTWAKLNSQLAFSTDGVASWLAQNASEL